MKKNYKNNHTFVEERQIKKHFLATYAMEDWNNFDFLADEVIKKLEK